MDPLRVNPANPANTPANLKSSESSSQHGVVSDCAANEKEQSQGAMLLKTQYKTLSNTLKQKPEKGLFASSRQNMPISPSATKRKNDSCKKSLEEIYAFIKNGLKHSTIDQLCDKTGINPKMINRMGLTLFHLIAINNDPEMLPLVDCLSKKGVDINAKDSNELTALHTAVSNKNLAAIEQFAKVENLNPNTTGRQGETALHLAAKDGYIPFLKVLQNREDYNPHVKDDTGVTALFYANNAKNFAFIDELLQDSRFKCEEETNALNNMFAENKDFLDRALEKDQPIFFAMLHMINVDLEKKMTKRFNLLQLAVKKGCIRVTQQLIRDSANNTVIDKQGYTLLHLAVKQDRLDIVELLINIGLDVNRQTIDGATACSLAKEKNLLGIIKLFRKYEKDDDSIDTSEHGLLGSVRANNIADVEKHIANGNFIPGALYKSGASGYYVSPAHIAAANESFECILLFVKAGLDINIQDGHDKKTIFHYAIENGCCKELLLALKKAAPETYKTLNPDLTDNNGNNLVHYAVRFWEELNSAAQGDQPELLHDMDAKFNAKNSAAQENQLKLLRDIGANINAQNINYDTPLHCAVRYENQIAIPLLLEQGADINAQNANYDTPLHLAIRDDNQEAITLLFERGTDIELQNRQNFTPVNMMFVAGNINMVQQTFAWFQEVSKASAGIENSNSRAQLKKDGFPVQDPRLLQALIAVMDAKQETLKQLVDDGINVSTLRIHGHSLLHAAVLKDDIKIIEQLIRAGIDVNMQTANGMTALYMAIQRLANTQEPPQNYTEIIELLLKEENIDLSLKTKFDFSPLYLALRLLNEFNNSKPTELLLKHKRVDIHQKLNGEQESAETPYKFMNKLYENIKNYTDKKQKANIQKMHARFTEENKIYDSKIISEPGSHLSDKELEDQRKLVEAVQKNDLKTVENLIALEVGVNGKTRNGDTALHIAVRGDKIEIIKKLCSAGTIDMYAKNNKGDTVLHVAATRERIESLEILLDHVTSDMINMQNNEGNTPLHLAAEYENEKALDLLLKSGANADLLNKKCQTLLICMLEKYLQELYSLRYVFKFKSEGVSLKVFFCLRILLDHKIIEIALVQKMWDDDKSNSHAIDQEFINMIPDKTVSRSHLSKKHEKLTSVDQCG